MRSLTIEKIIEDFNKKSWFYRMKIHYKNELICLLMIGFLPWLKSFKFSFNPKMK